MNSVGARGSRGPPELRQLRITWNPRSMVQELVDGDALGIWLGIIRQVSRDGRGEVNLASLHHLHNQRGGELLCHGAEPKSGIRGIRDVPFHVGFSITLAQDGLPVFRDQRRAVKQSQFC